MSIFILFIASLFLINISKYLSHTLMAPTSFLSMYWSVLTTVSLIGTILIYDWDFNGIIWLYIALIILNIGYFIGSPFSLLLSHRDIREKKVSLERINPSAWYLLGLLILFGLAKWALQVYTNGFSLSDFLSLENLADMNHEFAVNRYSGNAETGFIGLIISILNALVYAAPLCGGFVAAYAFTTKQKIIAGISLLPALLVTITNNTKAGMIGSILLFFSSYYIACFARSKKWKRIYLRTIVYAILGFILFLSFMIFSMMLRIGRLDLGTFSIVMQKLIVYAFGNVQSFDIWLARHYWYESNTFGSSTFLGLANIAGIAERVQGVYTELSGTSSNVYTVFRGIISDFGIIGGLLFVGINGFLLRVAINSIHKSYNPVISVTFSSATIFFFTFGMFISPWTYIAFMVAFCLFLFFVFISYHNSNLENTN